MDGWMDGWMQQPLDRQLTMLSVSFSKQRQFLASVFTEMLILHYFIVFFIPNMFQKQYRIASLKKKTAYSFIHYSPFFGHWQLVLDYCYILRLQFAFAISCGISLIITSYSYLGTCPFCRCRYHISQSSITELYMQSRLCIFQLYFQSDFFSNQPKPNVLGLVFGVQESGFRLGET